MLRKHAWELFKAFPCIMFGCFCECFNLKPHEFDPPWMWSWTACRRSGRLHGKVFHAMQITTCDDVNMWHLDNIHFQLLSIFHFSRLCDPRCMVWRVVLQKHWLVVTFSTYFWFSCKFMMILLHTKMLENEFVYNLQGLFTLLLQCSGGS